MKKSLHFALMLLTGLLMLGIGSGRVSARLTGTEPGTDISCWGPSGAEVCIDVSGNLIPTTDNDTTLGTSVLRWATAYIMDITVGDDLTVTDTLTVTGPFVPLSKTKAQFDTLDPVIAGEVYFCSDCTEKLLCVSTGTAAAQFQRVDSTTIGCGTGE